MAITTCVFDAYGTLFDVAGAARAAAQEPEFEQINSQWPKIAQDWRQKQLEFTWLRSIADQHTDFWQITCDSLDWALDAGGLSADLKLRQRLLDLYQELPAYPEVCDVLASIKDAGLATAILSNGTREMLETATNSAGLGAKLDAILSVDEVGIFKPHPRVYDLVGHHFRTQNPEVLFVSSNGWDAAGAAGYGFSTVWVNRQNAPVERLFANPMQECSTLDGILSFVGL